MAERIGLVTGGGSGVGRAVALTLARAGWRVFVAGRHREPLEETASAAPEGMVVPVSVDVTRPDSVTALFAEVERQAGRLDLLFNNAGIFGTPTPVQDISVADWTTVVDTNVNGMFWCAQEAFRMMSAQRPQGGRIINNGSISAHTPRPYSAPYTTTKHAVTGLTKSLALEGRGRGITCGQIDIGNAATDMTKGIASGALQADGSTRGEPTMDVQNVADVVLVMASLPPEANVAFVTVMASEMPYVGRG